MPQSLPGARILSYMYMILVYFDDPVCAMIFIVWLLNENHELKVAMCECEPNRVEAERQKKGQTTTFLTILRSSRSLLSAISFAWTVRRFVSNILPRFEPSDYYFPHDICTSNSLPTISSSFDESIWTWDHCEAKKSSERAREMRHHVASREEFGFSLAVFPDAYLPAQE